MVFGICGIANRNRNYLRTVPKIGDISKIRNPRLDPRPGYRYWSSYLMYRLQIHPFLNKHKVDHNAVQNTEWCPYLFTSIIYFKYSFASKPLAIFRWFILI